MASTALVVSRREDKPVSSEPSLKGHARGTEGGVAQETDATKCATTPVLGSNLPVNGAWARCVYEILGKHLLGNHLEPGAASTRTRGE